MTDQADTASQDVANLHATTSAARQGISTILDPNHGNDTGAPDAPNPGNDSMAMNFANELVECEDHRKQFAIRRRAFKGWQVASNY